MTRPKQQTPDAAAPSTPALLERASAWFGRAKVGVEFHWGAHADWALGENALFHQALPLEEYQARAEAWEPTTFQPLAWAEAARDAGARYVIFPARGSDGFCLWRTATTPFCSVHTAAARDFLAESLDAARQVGLQAGAAFSLADWSQPACRQGPSRALAKDWRAFTERVHAQLAEILGNCGRLDLVQLRDPAGLGAEAWRAGEIVKILRELQPEALLAYGWPAEEDWPLPDIHSRERPEFGHAGHWQTGVTLYPTLAEHGWQPAMAEADCASADLLVDQLITTCMAGGNLVLHLSPDSGGAWPVPVRKTLAGLGRWLAQHGEAIYGAQRARYQTGLRHTRRGRAIYLHYVDRATWAWDAANATYTFSGLREQIHGAFIPGQSQRAPRLTCDWSPEGRVRVHGLPEPGSPKWAKPCGTVGLRLGQE